MYMNKDEFWNIIADVNAASENNDRETVFARIVDRLSRYSFEDIMDWHLIFHEYKDAAIGNDMRAASTAMGPDYADEGLIEFRSWLISCGKGVYMNVLRDPDTLADVSPKDRYFSYVKFDYAAYCAYNAKLFLIDPDRPEDLISALESYTLDIRTVEDIHAELPQRMDVGWNWSRSSLPDLFPKICEKRKLAAPDTIQGLVNNWDVVHAHVYENGVREEFLFQNTPENIASFIGSRPFVERMVLTDPLDRLIMDTIGNFIDHCPDKMLLEEVKKILIPIQLGETKPQSFFCPSMEEVNAYRNQQMGPEMGMQMH